MGNEQHQAQRNVAIIGGIFALLAAIIGGIFLLANTILDKSIPPVPPVTVITQVVPITATETSQVPTSPVISNSQTILYIYYKDNGLTTEYKNLLASAGYEVKTVDIAQVKTMDLSQIGIIIVGADTIGSGTASMWYNAWGDEETVRVISDSGKPILGIGDGGYGIFALLGLRIGGGNGAEGTGNGTVQLTPYSTILDEPNKITNSEISLYSEAVKQREIYLGEDVSPTPKEAGVVEIGTMTYTNNGQTVKYGTVVMQSDKFVLWGFDASPSLLTAEGKNLFLNIVAYLLTK